MNPQLGQTETSKDPDLGRTEQSARQQHAIAYGNVLGGAAHVGPGLRGLIDQHSPVFFASELRLDDGVRARRDRRTRHDLGHRAAIQGSVGYMTGRNGSFQNHRHRSLRSGVNHVRRKNSEPVHGRVVERRDVQGGDHVLSQDVAKGGLEAADFRGQRRRLGKHPRPSFIDADHPVNHNGYPLSSLPRGATQKEQLHYGCKPWEALDR